MRFIRSVGAAVVAFGLFVPLVFVPAGALPAAGVRVNDVALEGPSVVLAGVETAWSGAFRTGVSVDRLGPSVGGFENGGRVVWLEVDGARVAAAVADAAGTFRFAHALSRGTHELRAVAEEGASPSASTSAPLVVEATVVPGAPAGVTVAATGWDRARVAWAAPEETGGRPLTYRVWLDGEEHARSTQATSVELSVAPESSRIVHVAACHEVGCGAASEAVHVQPPMPEVDEVRVAFRGMEVCTLVCYAADADGRVVVPTRDPFVVSAWFVGSLHASSAPVADLPVEVSGAMAPTRYTWESMTLRTDAEGEREEFAWPMGEWHPEGSGCTTFEVTATVAYLDKLAQATEPLTVCVV